MTRRVHIKPLHKETTSPKELKTPIKDAFEKIENYSSPLLRHELNRKRQTAKVTGK
jgi:hypothetical protein